MQNKIRLFCGCCVMERLWSGVPFWVMQHEGTIKYEKVMEMKNVHSFANMREKH